MSSRRSDRSGPPLFTAVIPLHNKQDFIGDTLRSALAQDHPSFEIVVVDDESTDGSAAVVERLADARIRLVKQANAGPGPARNRGAAEARGEWIAFLDADDHWLPDHLSALEAAIDAFPDADVVATGFARRRAGDAIAPAASREPSAPIPVDYFREAAQREVLWTSATAVRRDAFLASGGFGAFWPGEDMELWARLALDHRIARNPQVTALYVTHTGGLMDSWTARQSATFELQPVFATLDRALADARYRALHPAIRDYRSSLLLQGARQALYRGDTAHARFHFAEIARSGERVPPGLRLLSRLPGRVVATASRLYSVVKRAFD